MRSTSILLVLSLAASLGAQAIPGEGPALSMDRVTQAEISGGTPAAVTAANAFAGLPPS